MRNTSFQTFFFTFAIGLKALRAENDYYEFYNPRDEIHRLQTSGEESNRLKYQRFDSGKFHHDAVDDDKQFSQGIQISRKRADFLVDNEEIKNEKNWRTSKITIENEALSNQYGLNTTTDLSQVTLAHLINTATKHDNTYHSSSSRHKVRDIDRLQANYFLGLIYLYRLLPNTNQTDIKSMFSKAKHYLEIAANGGYVDAQCALGVVFYYCCDCALDDDNCALKKKQNQEKAISWFYKASYHHNHPRGHWLLGQALYNGWKYDVEPHNLTFRVLKDTKKPNFYEAAKLFHLAARHNISEAIHHLGLLHEYNLIPPDFDSQKNYTDITPRIPPIKKNEQMIHQTDRIEQIQNFRKAMKYYKEAYNLQPSFQSSYNIALIYSYGRGISQNFVRALEWFRKGAVIFKHAPSMRYLGILALQNGYGVSQNGVPDYKKGLEWLNQCVKVCQILIDNGDVDKNTLYWKDKCDKERYQIDLALHYGLHGEVNNYLELKPQQ